MASRVSLIEQKKLQWAKEREEMARLNVRHESSNRQPEIRTNIRTYPSITRLSSRETTGTSKNKPLRAVGHYGSTTSLRSLVDHADNNNSSSTMTSLRTLDLTTGSLINLIDGTEFTCTTKRRSPSLPPIYNKDNQQSSRLQDTPAELGVEGARWNNQPRSHKHNQRRTDRNLGIGQRVQLPYEEPEGETSGYASDSVEATVTSGTLGDCKRVESVMSERTWQNPYCETPETSLPPSRRLSAARLGDLNRPRWGSVWGQENGKTDPPPPSWLERGLCRLDNSSQVLVINHESASSPDSSTTGSTGSESKTYIRGQNIPMDRQVLQEREMKRQRALELQNAIKQQLEDKERQRKADKEKRLMEELEEEERIKRERDREKKRFDEEQRINREKECEKLRKEEAMRVSLESAERKAREEKKQKKKRQRDETMRDNETASKLEFESNYWESSSKITDECVSSSIAIAKISEKSLSRISANNSTIDDGNVENFGKMKTQVPTTSEKSENKDFCRKESMIDDKSGLPVGKEVAIVLSGRLENSEFLNRSNLQLVNLVMSSSPIKSDDCSKSSRDSVKAFVVSLEAGDFEKIGKIAGLSPRRVENRLLTPSQYRNNLGQGQGRDFGTQTDCESEIQDSGCKDIGCNKERKDVVNNNRRDVEKSTSTGPSDETMLLKPPGRSKSQPRTTLESRPRWNANRPGTRYRTQSEKDPHYQRRMRLRRRRVESSDERSRSPSTDRRKFVNQKSKSRNSNRRKVKIDSYDADLSMDSLNSVLPLKVDEHGRINILRINDKHRDGKLGGRNDEITPNDEKIGVWCGPEILSQLASLKNGLLSKQREWDPQRCLVSPNADFY